MVRSESDFQFCRFTFEITKPLIGSMGSSFDLVQLVPFGSRAFPRPTYIRKGVSYLKSVIFGTIQLCGTLTAFGSPVVPDVCMT